MAVMTGKYHWSSVVHAERKDGDGPACGAVSLSSWASNKLRSPQQISCGRCLKILTQRAVEICTCPETKLKGGEKAKCPACRRVQ